jgi:formylglycine-generating enzyme required for sulfatase activity
MNGNLLNVIKDIVSKNGEAVLSDPKRVFAFLADLAPEEPKPDKSALVRCLEQGFARILKDAPESERSNCEQYLAQRLHDEDRLDLDLCTETIELLAAVLFGEKKKAKKSNCKNCGKKMQEGWKACPYCGTSVESQAPVKNPPPIPVTKPVNSLGCEMVYVPGGSFQMGDIFGRGNYRELPVHTVTLSAFYIGKYAVTQALYESVMGNNPSKYRGGNLPVEQVPWYDAVEFCNRLSGKEGLQAVYTISDRKPERGYPVTDAKVTADWYKNGYRLPTEAEWEYAAKGGNGSPGNYEYAGSNNVDSVAWYADNSGKTPHAVGTKAPNGLGICDMSGNVWEWCWDCSSGGYSSNAQTDPVGISSMTDNRVIRGGSWGDPAEWVRSASRSKVDWRKGMGLPPVLGFRLARST